MTCEQAIEKFENDYPMYVVGLIAEYNGGFVVTPLARETHAHLMSYDYYLDPSDGKWKFFHIARKDLKNFEFKPVNTCALVELTRLADESDKYGKTQEERMEYVLSKASTYLKKYVVQDMEGESYFKHMTE